MPLGIQFHPQHNRLWFVHRCWWCREKQPRKVSFFSMFFGETYLNGEWKIRKLHRTGYKNEAFEGRNEDDHGALQIKSPRGVCLFVCRERCRRRCYLPPHVPTVPHHKTWKSFFAKQRRKLILWIELWNGIIEWATMRTVRVTLLHRWVLRYC